MMSAKTEAFKDYCKTHKLGLFLLWMVVFSAAIWANHGSGLLKVKIISPEQVSNYKKQSFFIYNRTAGFIHYALTYIGDSKTPDKNVRRLFEQYYGLEIFTAEICNSHHQCETVRPTIAYTFMCNPNSKSADARGYCPYNSNRLKLKNPQPIGRQTYSIVINPDFIDKIMPYYSLEFFVVEGIPDNYFLSQYMDCLSLIDYFFSVPIVLFLVLVLARYFLRKPKKGSK